MMIRGKLASFAEQLTQDSRVRNDHCLVETQRLIANAELNALVPSEA